MAAFSIEKKHKRKYSGTKGAQEMKELYNQMGGCTKFAARITLITAVSLIVAAFYAEFSGIYILMKLTGGLLNTAKITVFIGFAFVLAINGAERKAA